MSYNKLFRLAHALFLSLFLSVPLAWAKSFPVQTDINQAEHVVDESGVPHLNIKDVGLVEHPAWTALYALAYAGIEDYEPSLAIKADAVRFEASISWLKTNLQQNKAGLWVWPYQFDNTYNDISIKAPWGSAFAQATGIQALLAHWRITGDASSLELAEKAAQALFVPLQHGGFLFQRDKDVFFEEITQPVDNPSHILNGHMRVLLTLNELHSTTKNPVYADWFDKGTETLLRWLPLYDTGYWLRYDLNPRKDELLFRLANPYGFANPEVAIDRIVLRDPVSGEESVLDIGAADDAEGALRIAGNDWGQIEQLDGRSVRRLLPVSGQREPFDSEGQMVAPYSYFYLKLPAAWQDNLRRERLELMVEYLDEAPGNLQLQMRSIAPGASTFRELRDGDLLLSGSGQWRQWRVPLYGRDLGFWVGKLYAQKHAEYLHKLAQIDSRLSAWEQTAIAYLHSLDSESGFHAVSAEKIELPRQTPMLPIYSLDDSGVLMQHIPSSKTKFTNEGMYDGTSDRGHGVYSPYIVAEQLMKGKEIGGGAYSDWEILDIQRKPALIWLKNQYKRTPLGDSVVYKFEFPNTYNDIFTDASWSSAFGQAYVMKALNASLREFGADAETKALLEWAAYAYEVPTNHDGVSSFDKSGMIYFEEVPNNTHVLNAHLISILELAEIAKELDDPRIRHLATSGIDALRSKFSQFDTGYWLRYDLNPKKEMLFQFDWLSGEASPLIESIQLEAPQSAEKIELKVGADQAFDGFVRISGTEWLSNRQEDGKQVRAFSNGYLQHQEAVSGGTRHNVYALMQLPGKTFADYFDVYPHRLVIRYKDVSAGQFVVKVQSINEGNVLDFVPLRNAVITAVGDGQWKEAVIDVRPQDMGWYKGADYQSYEVEQLRNIATLTGDWFFEQYAARQSYFLRIKDEGGTPIIQPSFASSVGVPVSEPDRARIGLSVMESSLTYDGFGFENALDEDLAKDYVAGIENEGFSYVVLCASKPLDSANIKFHWESKVNFSGKIVISIPKGDDGWKEIGQFRITSGDETVINVHDMDASEKIKIVFSEFKGQSRLLLRGIEVYSTNEVHGMFSDDEISFLHDIELILKEKVFNRLKTYSAAPLFHQMTQDDAYFGTEGNCSHTALWSAIEMDAKGIEFRVLDIKSRSDDGQVLNHAMTEFKMGDKWILADPLNGWVYPKSFVEMRFSPAPPPPLNDGWNGRIGHEIYLESFFFKNAYRVEAYEDLAYTGLFYPKKQNWRYFLIK